jgi:hypothetical protein
LWYNVAYCRRDTPEFLTDPPLFRWIVPELDDLLWMFPDDPLMIDQTFLGQQPELDPQRLIFEWENTGDFQATFNVEGARGLAATLIDAEGNELASFGPLQPSLRASTAVGGVTVTQVLSVTHLPAGWYAIDIGEGAFPTYFGIDFVLPPKTWFLPLVLREE